MRHQTPFVIAAFALAFIVSMPTDLDAQVPYSDLPRPDEAVPQAMSQELPGFAGIYIDNDDIVILVKGNSHASKGVW